MPDVVDPTVPHTLTSCQGQVVEFQYLEKKSFNFPLKSSFFLQNPEDQENMGPLKFYPSVTANGTE